MLLILTLLFSLLLGYQTIKREQRAGFFAQHTRRAVHANRFKFQHDDVCPHSKPCGTVCTGPANLTPQPYLT